jgi:hypothetical protein
MRAVFSFLIFSGLFMPLVWLLTSLYGWNPLFLGASMAAGILFGALWAVPMLRGIEKNGEYRPSASNLNFPSVGVLPSVVLIIIFLLAATLHELNAFLGVIYLSFPVGWVVAAGIILRWERKNGKKVQPEGILVSRFYAVVRNIEVPSYNSPHGFTVA